MSGVKFSQFNTGGNAIAGDEVVGLRAGSNTRFSVALIANSVQVMQAMHGFSVGQVLTLSGGNYVLAKGDVSSDANVVGIVTSVIDVNTFLLQYGGYVKGLSGLTAGNVFFLSATVAGAMTSTAPSAAGQIRKPLLISDSTTSGFWLNYIGQQL